MYRKILSLFFLVWALSPPIGENAVGVVRQLVRQLVYQVCSTRYHVSFYLWLIGPVLKHSKVPKYYDHDCSLLNFVNLPPNLCPRLQSQ